MGFVLSLSNLKVQEVLLNNGILNPGVFMEIKQTVKIQYILVLSCTLVLLFTLSLLFFIIQRGDRTRIVLFFPETATGELMGEERYIKKEKENEDNIHALISELLLGPSLPGSSPLFPGDTAIIYVLLRKNHLYINFSKEIIFPDIKIPLDFHEGIRACINSIKFNFPWIKEISFFVNGEAVISQPWENPDQDDKNPKLKFATEMLK